jgi:aryl-alcohol dehydrogenase-like predicted oxidoreductase
MGVPWNCRQLGNTDLLVPKIGFGAISGQGTYFVVDVAEGASPMQLQRARKL